MGRGGQKKHTFATQTSCYLGIFFLNIRLNEEVIEWFLRWAHRSREGQPNIDVFWGAPKIVPSPTRWNFLSWDVSHGFSRMWCLFDRALISQTHCQGNSKDNHRLADEAQFSTWLFSAQIRRHHILTRTRSVLTESKLQCRNLPSVILKAIFRSSLNTQALGSHEFRNEDHCCADFHLLVWIEWCEKRWALAGLIHFSFYSIGCKCFEKTNGLLRRNFIDTHTHCTGIFERGFFLLPSEPQQKGAQSLIYRFTKCKN